MLDAILHDMRAPVVDIITILLNGDCNENDNDNENNGNINGNSNSKSNILHRLSNSNILMVTVM